MLLTITNAQPPATDLGYLLHKNPARLQTFPLPFGQAHVFYPEATLERCTAALLVEVDPVDLARSQRKAGTEGLLATYVNDRPYVASSFLSVAIARVFGTALSGHSKDRPELAETALPLEAHLAALPCRGGEPLLRRLFEPLGYTLSTQEHPLDEQFPDWGRSNYLSVMLTGCVRLSELLTHLYVLVPVLDKEKHYWIGEDEVDKLLRHGEGWLAAHPERALIARRYLKHQRNLTQEALRRLADEDNPQAEAESPNSIGQETEMEKPLKLNEQRLATVIAALREVGAHRVIDLGCGEGRLLRMLLAEKGFSEIAGMDISLHALARASRRLHLDRLPAGRRQHLNLFQGSLIYRDKRLAGYDAAAVVEVIEHLDSARLAAFERVLFEFARPQAVVLTTPNQEYNTLFKHLPASGRRHPDHRFEWTRHEFQAWAGAVAQRFGYTVHFQPIGLEDPMLGAPTQMGVFTL